MSPRLASLELPARHRQIGSAGQQPGTMLRSLYSMPVTVLSAALGILCFQALYVLLYGSSGDAENERVEYAGVEFAALNGYGKPLQNLKSTQRRYTTQYGDRLHCSAFDGENVMIFRLH